MRATDRLTRRGRDAAASAQGRGVLRRNDAGELVPLDPATAGGATAPAGDAATPTEARETVRQIDGQGWAR